MMDESKKGSAESEEKGESISGSEQSDLEKGKSEVEKKEGGEGEKAVSPSAQRVRRKTAHYKQKRVPQQRTYQQKVQKPADVQKVVSQKTEVTEQKKTAEEKRLQGVSVGVGEEVKVSTEIKEKIKKEMRKERKVVDVNGRKKLVKTYEFTLIIRPDLGEREAEVLDEIEKYISNSGANIVKKEEWGERELAYRIGRYDRGKYIYYEYESTGLFHDEFRKFLERHDAVLRYLFVKKEKIETKGHLWWKKMKEQLSQ